MCFYILGFFFVNRLLYRCKIYAVTPSPCIFPSTTDAVQIGPTSYNSGQIAPSTVFAIEREVIARAWCIRPGIFSRCGFARPPLLLLRGLLRLRRLERLLPVAPDHDAGEEAADDGAAEQDQDDGDADGPDARREERLERVVLVDEGHQQGPHGVVGEDGGCYDEHGESDEAIEHCEKRNARSGRKEGTKVV